MILDMPAWAPTVDGVAARLLARTQQTNGVMAKTFNSYTFPTDTDVTALIQEAVTLIRPRLGPVPDALSDSAQALVTLRAAMMVELSCFPEQVGEATSPYNSLEMEYRLALKDWDEQAKGQEPGGYKVASMPIGTLYPGYATGTY